MEKFKDFINKYRHPLCMLAILLCSVVVFAWVGLLSLDGAAEKSQRLIVNDDYSVLTEEIKSGDGIRQTIQVKGGSRLYGISANFHIFNRVQHGRIYAEILDGAGNLLAKAEDDLTTLKDNTFKGFIFDNPLFPKEDTEYIFRVYIRPESEEDRIALWKSRQTYNGFELAENGNRTEGTIALQYTNRHVGRDVYTFYYLIAAVAIIGMELLYLLIFVKKAKTENIFALAALILGGIFCLFTPISGGPDEYVHISSSYIISNEFMGIGRSPNYDRLYVRRCDDVIDLMSTADYSPFSFQQMVEGLGQSAGDNTQIVEVAGRDMKKGSIIYLPQALGITFARFMNFGFIQLILTGRMFNLLFFIALVWLAVKIMPVYKTTLALCALLPMTMQLAGNFNYDTFINGVAYLFIAAVFRIAYKEGKAKITDWILPVITLCLLTPIKPIYIVMGLLVYIVPGSKFNNKYVGMAIKTAVLAVGIFLWASINMASVIKTLTPHDDHMQFNQVILDTQPTPAPEIPTETPQPTPVPEAPAETPQPTPAPLYPFDNTPKDEPVDDSLTHWDPNGDLMPNGDSKYYFNVSYILSHLRQTVKLVMNTITHKSTEYIETMIGTRLGEIVVIDLTASPLFLMAIILVLVLSVLNAQGDSFLYHWFTRLCGVTVFIGVVALTVAACIMWTPINYEIIFGIQGRYFLPALPLMVMALANRQVTLKNKIDGALLFAMVPLNLLVILNAFIIMCK